MPKNEDGEFELILGNRQLLSVFFIVVVLLGVFFTMGYIVGRNSGPLAPAEVVATRKEPKPIVIESPVPAAEPKVQPPVETKPQVPETKKQTDPPKPQPTKVEQAKPEPVKPGPFKKFEPATKAPPPRVERAEQPATGQTYLQLTATSQHEAEVYADVLKKKGFNAITAVVPDKPGLVRVLVGPMPESSVSKTKADLTAAGFPGDQAIKRTL
jgi:cell division septation protein DedD